MISLTCLLAFAVSAPGQSTALNYSGRISVDNKPFTGTGSFAFTIQQTNNTVLWTSGDLPLEGSTKLPPRIIKLAVRDGLYTIRLGDPTLGMAPIDLETLRRATAPMLRVWFNDGLHGWHPAGADAPLADALQSTDKAPITIAQADAILREIREVRALLERPSAKPLVTGAAPAPATGPQMATVSINGAPSRGRSDAPLVLVEFTDFECPYCKEAHDGALAKVTAKYVETGKVRLVTRNLPLPFHPNAASAAAAALCADKQQQFWPMRDKLFSTGKALNTTNYLNAASELNLDMAAFRACLQGNPFADRVQKELHEALAAGINSTPSFILGTANGDQVTGEVLIGARTFAAFEQDIQKRLSR